MIFWGMLVALVLAIGIGVFSAIRQYSVGDYLFTGLAYIGVAMPPFWFGLLLIQFFGVGPEGEVRPRPTPVLLRRAALHREEGFNIDYVRHLVLPVLDPLRAARGAVEPFPAGRRCSMCCRATSSAPRGPRACHDRKVVRRHAFRNALIPLMTDVATQSGLLFGGLVITEAIFSIPGMGRLFIDSLLTGDVYAVLGYVMVDRRVRHHLQPHRRPALRRARPPGAPLMTDHRAVCPTTANADHELMAGVPGRRPHPVAAVPAAGSSATSSP